MEKPFSKKQPSSVERYSNHIFFILLLLHYLETKNDSPLHQFANDLSTPKCTKPTTSNYQSYEAKTLLAENQ